MLGVVVGLVAMENMQGVWRLLIIVAIVIMAIVLPATWSRAAFLGVTVVTLFIYRDKYCKYRYPIWGAILIVAIAFYLIKEGSADGRLIIWKSALTTWTGTPWLGVGVGGFYHAFAEGMAQLYTSGMDFYSADVPDSAYNILIKIVVEQGVVGGLVALSLAAVTLNGLSRNSRSLFYGIVALLVFAMFSYPFDLLPYKVIAVLAVAWSESFGGKRLFEIGRSQLFLLSAFFGFASWHAGKIVEE